MNVIYFKDINSIGGVEQFIWYLSKKYEFTLYYNSADTEQIKSPLWTAMWSWSFPP